MKRGIALTLLCASPVAAQLDGPPEMRKGPEADYILANYARCMVDGDPKGAAALLAIAPDKREAAEASFEFLKASPFCAPPDTALHMPRITLRQAIAEQLYLRTYRTPITPRPADAAFASVPVRSARPYGVAQCAADRDPVAADAIVRSKRGSPAEQAAVDRLKPALAACSAGRVNFDGPSIHGLLAEGLYHLRADAQTTPILQAAK